MRRASKVDANHEPIVWALRQAGCGVQSLAMVGGGCPDLLVGRAGTNYLLEVKDGALVPSRQRLTPDQVYWHRLWRGRVDLVHNVEEAFRVVGLL